MTRIIIDTGAWCGLFSWCWICWYHGVRRRPKG